jgi:hypothetical protein
VLPLREHVIHRIGFSNPFAFGGFGLGLRCSQLNDVLSRRSFFHLPALVRYRLTVALVALAGLVVLALAPHPVRNRTMGNDRWCRQNQS